VKLILSPLATLDIASIHSTSQRLFGQKQADAYIDLIDDGFTSIAADPFRPSCRRCPQLGERVQSFPLSLARKRRSSASHVMYFRVAGEVGSQELQIVRILHERMEPLTEIEAAIRLLK